MNTYNLIGVIMRKFSVITTFNDEGYEVYGHKMIDSFGQFWPKSIDLYVYYEGTRPNLKFDNVFYLDLLKTCPELVKFKQRWKDNPAANGSGGTIGDKSVSSGFRWDAVRFSHKTYCVFHGTQTINADVVIWLDADTLTFRQISQDFLEQLIPQDVYTCYLGRGRKYSECGFVSYNVKHNIHKTFMNSWQELYDNDLLFDLDEYHDSYLYDYIRKKYEAQGIKNHDIVQGKYNGETHPFINSDLGAYMDHLKGPRKINGQSWRQDLRIKRQEQYWNNMRSKGQFKK